MTELSKTYEPHDVEDKWIKDWLDKKVFSPSPQPSPARGKGINKNFSVVIPPPNVTGSLHMGHALNNTIQDILVRYHRMQGDHTLWVVGTDHAGIATQNVVERQLKAEGKNRDDLGREKFIERVWEWKAESGGTIINQLKRLGASCDFANERFTMDEGLSSAVKKVFVQLYNEGLIYRGLRLINWCPRCHTALSDLEVEHENKKGKLWEIKYPVTRLSSLVSREDNQNETLHASRTTLHDFVVVATTRPETLFGDTAVAVHPEDERTKHLIGKTVKIPLCHREIPVIADEMVDREFGSGVVKITPAHDFNDFAAGKRHHLAEINIFTESAALNENVPEAYRGLDRFKAREKVLEDLKAEGLLVGEKDHESSIGHCYRCRTVVEPYLSLQWYVKTKPLAEPAIAAVKSGKTRFVPEHWEKTYFNWMENIQDWCISRQIWWGHQIPAWYCESSLVARRSSLVADDDKKNKDSTLHASRETLHECPPIVSETTPTQCPTCGSTKLRQETDVLDTWFSSSLWPFSTLGWPEQTEKLKTFYPTSTLVTAFDIIFFWVARMMMMGIHFMKEVPFQDVHIHAIVRDPTGAKMSKSKGNVVDPLVLMEKYGTDAFRFTLAAFAAQGRDIKLDEARVEGYRNFCNKIWNATRFAMMTASPFIKNENDFISVGAHGHAPLQDDLNKWILTRLNFAIKESSQKIEVYEFNMAAHALYKFFWNEFCDAYVEYSKEIYKSDNEELKKETALTTYYVLDNAMRLMHPFMPFITEEIWQVLADRNQKSIAKSSYPQAQDLSAYQKAAEGIELVSELLSAIRSTRQELGISLTDPVDIELRLEKSAALSINSYQARLSRLGKVGQINSSDDLSLTGVAKPSVLTKTKSGWVIFPGLEEKYLAKAKDLQEKRLKQTLKDIDSLTKQVSDPNFPPELKKEKATLLEEATTRKADIEKSIRFI